MKQIRITNSYWATDGYGNPKMIFEGGRLYPVDADTQRQVVLGNAVEVDVPTAADEPAGVAEQAPAAVVDAAPPAPPAAAKPAKAAKSAS